MSQQYIADTTESIIFNGYKQTEIGIIPIDWNVVNIGSLCSIFGRIGFRGYTKADIVSEDQGAVSISPSNIVDGKVSWEKGTYISWRKYHESADNRAYAGRFLHGNGDNPDQGNRLHSPYHQRRSCRRSFLRSA